MLMPSPGQRVAVGLRDQLVALDRPLQESPRAEGVRVAHSSSSWFCPYTSTSTIPPAALTARTGP
ncbi:hypothetical protein J7F01_40610 [Streptomyces sp. ISL-22]|uniref:hypothetical protein n=1 Tax=unclassified Streptomyces TaxID=2593676 RepID=UPI001BEC1122|nr:MULTISPECIES: hypothetical protein [unclassified Streptomyces]MBT2421869.1 hypothetical protein [Streptomyces sp. ISL-24]MBT2438314.1 hypothetical protein [Streptomyces sp. ISL-22]